MRAPKVPGQGPRAPKHNQGNRLSRESRTRERMLDQSKANYFKYELQDFLKTTAVPEDQHMAIIQSLWSRGSRSDVKEAKDYLKDKVKDKTIPMELEAKILGMLDRYSTWR